MGEIAVILRGALERVACEHGWPILELNVQEDHVHMLVQLNPKTSVARAVQFLKGNSSLRLRRERPDLNKTLWGEILWADGYFAETVGAVEEETIRRYIREQPEKDQSR